MSIKTFLNHRYVERKHQDPGIRSRNWTSLDHSVQPCSGLYRLDRFAILAVSLIQLHHLDRYLQYAHTLCPVDHTRIGHHLHQFRSDHPSQLI